MKEHGAFHESPDLVGRQCLCNKQGSGNRLMAIRLVLAQLFQALSIKHKEMRENEVAVQFCSKVLYDGKHRE